MRREMVRIQAALWASLVLGCSGTAGSPGPDVSGEVVARDPGTGDPGWEDVGSRDGESGGGRDPGAGGTDDDPGSAEDPGAGDPSAGEEPSGDPGEAGDPGPDPGGDGELGDGGGPPGDGGVGDPGGEEPGSGPFTVRVRPAVREDVVASYLMSVNPSAWNLFGGDSLPLGRHFDGEMGHVGYHSAIRFPGLAIPRGARILSATLSFLPTNEVDSSNILWLAIHAEQSADSRPLSLSDYEQGRPDQRLRTVAAIDQWVIRCNASCTEVTEYDCPQRKRDCWDRTVRFQCPKDLKALVQEVVDLPGWQSGNALTLILQPNVPQEYRDRDTGARHIVGVEDGRPEEDRPLLEVTWDRP
ncbi:hypothetical protein KBD49_08230 [Myxococcota bacterium]|nr:hypothetical protein [Myxococcota bacterium]